jgi:hypothetical protein
MKCPNWKTTQFTNWEFVAQKYSMAMITEALRTAVPTWHMIPTLTTVRCPDNTVMLQTVTDWRPEEDFSWDQELLNLPPRIMEKLARGTVICSGQRLFI